MVEQDHTDAFGSGWGSGKTASFDGSLFELSEQNLLADFHRHHVLRAKRSTLRSCGAWANVSAGRWKPGHRVHAPDLEEARAECGDVILTRSLSQICPPMDFGINHVSNLRSQQARSPVLRSNFKHKLLELPSTLIVLY